MSRSGKFLGPGASLQCEYNILSPDHQLIDDLNNEVSIRAVSTLKQVGNILMRRIYAKLSNFGTGRWWPSKRPEGGKHQASKPGRPPAPDRGVYRDSFYTKIDRGQYEWGVRLLSSLWGKFGRRLELGGMGGGAYIAPRPHVRPVMEEATNEIQTALDQFDLMENDSIWPDQNADVDQVSGLDIEDFEGFYE